MFLIYLFDFCLDLANVFLLDSIVELIFVSFVLPHQPSHIANLLRVVLLIQAHDLLSIHLHFRRIVLFLLFLSFRFFLHSTKFLRLIFFIFILVFVAPPLPCQLLLLFFSFEFLDILRAICDSPLSRASATALAPSTTAFSSSSSPSPASASPTAHVLLLRHLFFPFCYFFLLFMPYVIYFAHQRSCMVLSVFLFVYKVAGIRRLYVRSRYLDFLDIGYDCACSINKRHIS
mmetsp:Transcript_8088/g.13037  ORF Transcript_8088/g.13037 Transcript_8088/m.13037 type:complete len:231 (+) Transcript_8088:455-1147(+)